MIFLACIHHMYCIDDDIIPVYNWMQCVLYVLKNFFLLDIKQQFCIFIFYCCFLQRYAPWTAALTVYVLVEHVVVKKGGLGWHVTNVFATLAALNMELAKMENVNAERAGMGSTAPLVGKRRASKEAHIALFSYNISRYVLFHQGSLFFSTAEYKLRTSK